MSTTSHGIPSDEHTDGSRGSAGGGGPPAGMTIGDLAAATGVSVATLRTWESRHGYPRPERRGRGHRRYEARDLTTIKDIERRRASGQTLSAAIAAALARHVEPETSVFAGLRRRHPGLAPRRVRKATLLALTRAIEDECCARAESAVLIGCFQRDRFYAQSRRRWVDLARTAQATVVFTDVEHRDTSGVLQQVVIEPNSPLRREWVVVCDASDHAAALAAWEIPASSAGADPDREFEVIWTAQPDVVRDAARICAALIADEALRARLADRLDEAAPVGSADLRRAQGLLERTLDYLGRTSH